MSPQKQDSLLHRGFDVLLLKIYALDGNVSGFLVTYYRLAHNSLTLPSSAYIFNSSTSKPLWRREETRRENGKVN